MPKLPKKRHKRLCSLPVALCNVARKRDSADWAGSSTGSEAAVPCRPRGSRYSSEAPVATPFSDGGAILPSISSKYACAATMAALSPQRRSGGRCSRTPRRPASSVIAAQVRVAVTPPAAISVRAGQLQRPVELAHHRVGNGGERGGKLGGSVRRLHAGRLTMSSAGFQPLNGNPACRRRSGRGQ